MFSKIIFTLAVVFAALMFARMRRRPGLESPAARRAVVEQTSRRADTVRILALAVVALMIAGAAFYLYSDWRAASEIVQVRVIDAGSGKVSEYQAYRGEIEDRSFRTRDGRRVVLADTERMETAAVSGK